MDHKKILTAYLARLRTSDLKAILEADQEGWYAQANLGINAQIKAHDNFNQVCATAIDKLMDCDRRLIESAIRTGIKEKTE